MEESMEVLSWGSRYVLSSYGPSLLCVLHSSLWVVVCVEGLCVTWLDLVIACGGLEREKLCENSFGWW